jgi:hypothetical protein
LHKQIDRFRQILGDFVKFDAIDANDADVSQPAIEHIENEIAKYQAEYVMNSN